MRDFYKFFQITALISLFSSFVYSGYRNKPESDSNQKYISLKRGKNKYLHTMDA